MKLKKLNLALITLLTGILAIAGKVAIGFSAERLFIPQAQVAKETEESNISSKSESAEIALARHLKSKGAKMYGAFWCRHCQMQKQLFGEEAFAIIDYIECDARGENARPQLCKAARIQGYPTWEINGKLYPGMQTLEKLADLSGYKGARQFKNK
ncbi:MAG: hypothetical protein N3E45_12750 [Oscillatoriaceae bacterium SKW80]|nr:hypothetical protein [Oscillatoriaceae bacterium SKYG93]MCX8121669.1 hypothetical protein [Oscillatoriaceae bacterium SKW80]MDW8453978.1 hypothetical protein [Oscillatoriaceae cyanobacterium SKYGB_i_bin93]HIK28779.1 hypothetical protein [Oscillatoriaceae cyanobacterium M7585_C2015_266]